MLSACSGDDIIDLYVSPVGASMIASVVCASLNSFVVNFFVFSSMYDMYFGFAAPCSNCICASMFVLLTLIPFGQVIVSFWILHSSNPVAYPGHGDIHVFASFSVFMFCSSLYVCVACSF